MSILSVSMTQQGTSLNAEGPDDKTVKRKFKGYYRVITDDPETSPKAVETHFKATKTLPWMGRSWKWANGGANGKEIDSICKGLEVSYVEKSSGIFEVVATYEPKDTSKPQENPTNEGENSTDPMLWREQISVSYTQTSVPVMFAEFLGFTSGQFANDPANGTGLMQKGRHYCPMGSNLVPYDPLPEMELDIAIIRLVRNFPVFDQTQFNKWQGAVNSDEMDINKPHLGFRYKASPLTARIKAIQGSNQFENKINFWRREVEIWVNPLGWRGRLLDAGDCAILSPEDDGYEPGGGLTTKPYQQEQKQFRDADGYPSMAPKPLNGFGRLLRTDKPNQQMWTNWKYYHELQYQGFDW